MKDYFDSIAKTMEKMDSEAGLNAIRIVHEALVIGKLVCTIGNGGSSSTASHFVNDWVKGLSQKNGLNCRALCLSDNVSLITAIANDLGYENIFALQIEKYMRQEDLLVCLSGSGNSPNIIRAAQTARERGIKVVGLTGFNGGILLPLLDFSFHVPIEDMQIVEDIHSTFGHLVLRYLK